MFDASRILTDASAGNMNHLDDPELFQRFGHVSKWWHSIWQRVVLRRSFMLGVFKSTARQFRSFWAMLDKDPHLHRYIYVAVFEVRIPGNYGSRSGEFSRHDVKKRKTDIKNMKFTIILTELTMGLALHIGFKTNLRELALNTEDTSLTAIAVLLQRVLPRSGGSRSIPIRP